MNFATLRGGRTTHVLAFVLALCGVGRAYADSVALMWDPNQGPVNGYAVYVGSSRVDVGNNTSYTLTTAVPGQRYCFAVSAYNASGEGAKSDQVCGYSNEFPTLTIPGTQSSRVGQAASLQLAGNDPDGLPVSYTATGLPPGLFIGSATGFISGTPTTAGTYSVTAGVSDGVLQSVSQTFTWSVAPAPADTTLPIISIATPTTGASMTASSLNMSLGGTASDNVGVTSVSWSNSRGGTGSASGTTAWTVPSIGLQAGTNVITVTARDSAGNLGTDVLTVTYSEPDTSKPSVTISGPTAGTSYTASASPLTVSGTSSDNIGVTQVNWSTDRGASGSASGTTNWTAAGIALQSGSNIVTVTARDLAGNTSTAILTVTYTVAPTDQTAPAISILGPTSGSSYSTASSVLTLGGSASDSFGVTAVTWTNDRGGSGFSSGTTSWSVPSVNLASGTNVITVTAQDAAGNKASDVLTVTYSAPSQAPPPPSSIVLSGQLLTSGRWVKASLQWSQVRARTVDLYLNGRWVDRTQNDGRELETPRGSGPYSYKLCVGGTTNCSNTLVLTN